MERFRELNSRQLRALLGTIAEADLETVERAMEILREATARRRAAAGRPPVPDLLPPQPPTKGVPSEPPQSNSPSASAASRCCWPPRCSSPGSRPGAASSRNSCRTSNSRSSPSWPRIPGAGSSDVAEQVTKPIENAISGVRASRRCSRPRPTRSRWSSPSSRTARTSRKRPRRSRRGSPRPACPRASIRPSPP